MTAHIHEKTHACEFTKNSHGRTLPCVILRRSTFGYRGDDVASKNLHTVQFTEAIGAA